MDVADPARARALSLGWFASFDPGVRYPAAAIWHMGRLVTASRIPVPGKLAQLDRVERCKQIAKIAAPWILERMPGGRPLAVAMEYPKVLPPERSKGDPNDLLFLACLDGALAMALDVETISPLPGEWSLIPKREREFKDPWESPRGKVVSSRLTPFERAVVVPSHDAVDSVGIGLKILARLERRLHGTT